MGSSTATRTVSTLVALVFQLGWRMTAGNCIPAQDLAEASRCCQKENYIPRDVAQSCFARADMNDDSNELTLCILTCAYEAMGVMTEGGEVDVGRYLPYLAHIEESFREVVISGVTNCANFSNDIKWGTRDIHVNCNSYPAAFHMCVMQYITEHCPDSRYHATPVCDKVKQRMTSC